MELEQTPTGTQEQTPAPVEKKGDFGWLSPEKPAPDNTPAPEAPVDTPATDAPSADAASASDQAQSGEDDNWFDIGIEESGSGGEGGSAAPAAAPETPAATESEKPATTAPDWRQIVKGVPREELLKELGIEDDDDFERGFKKFRRGGGNPLDYLEAKSRDWSKVSDTELAMSALAQRYPGLDKSELQRLFDSEYRQTDLDTDEDKEIGALKLKSAASSQRQALIEKQKQFVIPEIQAPAADEEAVISKYREKYIQEATEKAKKENEAYINDPTTQAIISSKRIAIPMGDKSFNVGIDPNKLIGFFTDPEVYKSITLPIKGADGQGKPDMATEQAIAAIRIMGIPKFTQALMTAAEGRVKKAMVEEAQNIGAGRTAVPPAIEKLPPQWKSV